MPAGKSFCRSASRACTASETATELRPDCLSTLKLTALSPLARTRVRSSSKPSSTVPMSDSRTPEPSLLVATMMLRTSSTSCSSPTVRTLISCCP